MKNLLKNTKSLLSVLLAVAVLATSLFTGVVSVSAACSESGTVVYWDGTATAPTDDGAGTAEDPVIINTPAELAYIATAGYDYTTINGQNKYFKVADGIKAFVLQSETYGEEIMALNGAAAVAAYYGDTTKSFQQWLGVSDTKVEHIFAGYLDGNGITIYGLYNTQGGKRQGLIGETDGNVTVCNLNVKGAYLTTTQGWYGQGAIIGANKNKAGKGVLLPDGTTKGFDTTVIKNCAVTDCYMRSSDTVNDNRKSNAVLMGATDGVIMVDSCLIRGNDTLFTNNTLSQAYSLFGTAKNGWNQVSTNKYFAGEYDNYYPTLVLNADCVCCLVVNTVSIGTVPYHIGYYSNRIDNDECFINVYSDAPTGTIKNTYIAGGVEYEATENYVDGTISTIDPAAFTGKAAVEACPGLDWDNIWFANEGEPVLRAQHNIVPDATNKHRESCADCGIVGAVESAHNYVDRVCTICDLKINCGEGIVYWTGGTDGNLADNGETGADWDNAIIIDSAEELNYITTQCHAGFNGKYYKVADFIDVMVLQPENVIDLDALLACEDADAVKAYIEGLEGKVSWNNPDLGDRYFDGNFDGNGVVIYGMYGYNMANKAAVGLFQGIESSFDKTGNYESPEYDFYGTPAKSWYDTDMDEGLTIGNFAIRNSYVTSDRRMGIVAGMTASPKYGSKLTGRIDFTDIEVSNCYALATKTAAKGTQGIISGETGGDLITWNNLIVYGSKGLFADGSELHLIGQANTFKAMPTGMGEYAFNFVNEDVCIENTVTNSIILGVAPYNACCGGYRTSGSAVFENVYTDAPVGKIIIAGATFDYKETDIKSVEGLTGADLAAACDTLDWENTFLATAGMPTLRSTHDAELTTTLAEDNYAGHVAACSCGLEFGFAAHTYVVEGEGEEATYTCSVCDFECDHAGDETHWNEVITDANCVTGDTYTFTCDCGFIFYDEGEALGHEFELKEAVAGADCQTAGTKAYNYCSVCEKNYEADADVYEPFENAITDLTGENGTCVPKTENDKVVYEKDDNNHWTVCSACNEIIETNPHTGEATSNGATGHSMVCTVCGHASENAAHVFGDDSVCDECGYECVEHAYEDGETTTLYWDCTPDACKEVAQICSLCGHEGTPRKIGHTAGEWQAMNPWRDMNYVGTCTGAGQHTEVQMCSECMYYEFGTRIVTDEKTGHTFTEYEAAEATCSFEGNIAYKQCDVCYNKYAMDAAYDEAFENALTDEQVYIAINPENHSWVEYASTATCDEDGIVAHKFCTECYLFVIGEEATDLAIDWDAYYAYDEETGAPIGIGAKLDAELGAIENKAFADFIAENYADAEIEVPEYPADPNDWEAMGAYNDEFYAIWDVLFEIDENWQEAWGEYWAPIIEELQLEAHHEAFLLAAATAEVDMTEAATGHAYDNACDATCNNGCGTVREVPDHVYDNDDDMNCNECGAERVFAWNISVGVTGTYTIAPNDAYTAEFDAADIVVLDKNGNEVKATADGYPLVKDVVYTIELVNIDFLKDVDGVLAWDLTKEDAKLFPDTNNGDWYGDAVNYVVGAGIMSGYASNGKFGTSDSIQRQDFIVMLARYAGVDLSAYDYDCELKDVAADGYYKAAINWALAMGITTGYENGKFGVGDKMTREQLVTFLYRYANIIGVDTTVDDATKAEAAAKYADFGKVSPFSTDAIVWALSKGVISGQGGVKVDPQGGAQRCQVAQIMYNIFANDIFAI